MLSHALHARFADASEQRANDRRVLRLEAHAATSQGEGGLQIHNLSRTGMLAECASDIPIGTNIEVELPDGARHRAEVVWQDASLFGCRFAKPLSQATLSAALLRATPLAADAVKVVCHDPLAVLREHWNVESDAAQPRANRLPLGTRLWAIIGLGLAGWAVPTAGLAWMLA